MEDIVSSVQRYWSSNAETTEVVYQNMMTVASMLSDISLYESQGFTWELDNLKAQARGLFEATVQVASANGEFW